MPALYGSTFHNATLYYALFEAAARRRAEMPKTLLTAGTTVLASDLRKHEGVTNTADKARTIFGGSRQQEPVPKPNLAATWRWAGLYYLSTLPTFSRRPRLGDARLAVRARTETPGAEAGFGYEP